MAPPNRALAEITPEFCADFGVTIDDVDACALTLKVGNHSRVTHILVDSAPDLDAYNMSMLCAPNGLGSRGSWPLICETDVTPGSLVRTLRFYLGGCHPRPRSARSRHT